MGMNTIDNYTWRRQDPEVGGVVPPETYQNAIGSGTPDANGLTTFTGCNGQDVCVFDSILFAQFYETVGQVTGDGLATLQFDTTARRALKGSRKLQQTDAAAAADGIVMNTIDNYTWRRQDPEVGGVVPPETYQNAI